MVDFAKEVLPIDIEEEMKQSYLDYAMSVIVGRALPDVRDGLKPWSDQFDHVHYAQDCGDARKQVGKDH